MAKKDTNYFGSMQSIKKKEKLLLQTNIIMALAIGVVLFYFLWCYAAYSAENLRETGGALISGAISYMSTPGKLFEEGHAPYSLGNAFGITLVVELLLSVLYFTDKMKIHHDVNTLKGSSEWANHQEILERYAEFDDGKNYKNSYNNIILGEDIYVSLNAGKHFKALNTLIVGTTGSGKSRYFLKPNLLQMNSSYVVTDPKGEILDSCGEMLRRNGYRVRVFDILNMGNCDTYNPLKYCEKESDVKKIVQAFIKNTAPDGGKGGGGNKDPFWDDSMNQFLCATISLLTSAPKTIIAKDGSIKENTEKRTYGLIPEIMGGKEYDPCFSNIIELLVMAGAKWTRQCGIALQDGVEEIVSKEKTVAASSRLNAIFENLRRYEGKRQDKEIDFIEKPYCLREWENLKGTPDKTYSTILTTISVRLDSFNIEQVRNLTSTDSIDLKNFGTRRDALFLIIPPTDRTYNFLVAFLYTQLFDILYKTGAEGSIGSKILKLSNGEIVKYFPKEEVDKGIDKEVENIKNAKLRHNEGAGKETVKVSGKKKKKQNHITLDDGWYDILDANDNLISRRPTKAKAEKYLHELKEAKLYNGRNPKLPYHVRFLMDEFANIGELPEFKDKLATVRGYEISCTVICQSITQLKGMYPDDYEVVDANCPFTIFLGGDENTNNEYISKKIGKATIKGYNVSLDNKNKANNSFNVEERDLIKPEELGRMPYENEIVLIYGEQPIVDKKADYVKLPNYNQTHDYTADMGRDDFSVFVRPILNNVSAQIIREPVEFSAIPGAFPFTEEIFLNIFHSATITDALEHVTRNLERNPFSVAESQATEF